MSVYASFIVDFWEDQLVSNSRHGLFLVLVGFLGSFGFIRLSTRLMRSPRVPWWPGSVVSDSGVHLHHLVFGIILMGISGTLGFWFFDSGIWMEISALLFGIGIGLTIDEPSGLARRGADRGRKRRDRRQRTELGSRPLRRR